MTILKKLTNLISGPSSPVEPDSLAVDYIAKHFPNLVGNKEVALLISEEWDHFNDEPMVSERLFSVLNSFNSKCSNET